MNAIARQQYADATRATKRGNDLDVIHFDLPLPPSANRLWSVGKNKRVYTSATYKAWQIRAGWELQTQKRKLAGFFPLREYAIAVHLPEKMNGDVDNRAKPIGDLLQKNGVVENDKFCQRFDIFRADTVLRGRCHVALFPAEAE